MLKKHKAITTITLLRVSRHRLIMLKIDSILLGLAYLNTSHVKVNPLDALHHGSYCINLNTSHVKVNRSTGIKNYIYFKIFKYISC